MFYMAGVRPFKLLFLSPIVLIMTLFGAVSYGYLYLMFTTISAIFIDTYGWPQQITGLAYLGFGVGCIIGLLVTGSVANKIAAKHSAQGRFTPESRLGPMLVACWLLPIGLFWYGWSAEKHVHWIMPLIGTAIFGCGLMAVFVSFAPMPIFVSLIFVWLTAATALYKHLSGRLLYPICCVGYGCQCRNSVASWCFSPAGWAIDV
jgi:hypothetical protein